MAYLERIDDAGSNRIRLMHEQTRNAAAVWAGEAVVDMELFLPLPHHLEHAATEADNSPTAMKDIFTAFSGGLYTHIYGPATEKLRPKPWPEGTVQRSLQRWNAIVNESYTAKTSPRAFQKVFFEGGVWQLFIDRFSLNDAPRQLLEQATDYRPFRKSRTLNTFIETQVRPYFSRAESAKPPSHPGSHHDAVMFANTVLDVGERQLGLRNADDKAELLKKSLPELRRLATRLDMEGVNLATSGLFNAAGFYDEKYLTIAERRVGFNLDEIQDRIEVDYPDVVNHNHRGCPVVFQPTRYKGKETPIFSVMNDKLIDIYRITGALSLPELRSVQAN